MQPALPAAGLYLPAAHKLHDCASGPVWPAVHPAATQSARASLPSGELLPAGQAVHNSLPFVGLYVPAAHTVHVPPSGPVDPAAHRGSMQELDAVGDVQPAGQALHVAAEVAPVTLEYVLAAHPTQTFSFIDPVHWVVWYLPTGHKTHDSPFGKKPAAHTQCASDALPPGAVFP